MATIRVEKQDIEGAGSVQDNCPVARALHRQGYPRSIVLRRSVILNTGSTVELPKDVVEKIRIYDRGHDGEGLGCGVMEPFTFEFGG